MPNTDPTINPNLPAPLTANVQWVDGREPPEAVLGGPGGLEPEPTSGPEIDIEFPDTTPPAEARPPATLVTLLILGGAAFAVYTLYKR